MKARAEKNSQITLKLDLEKLHTEFEFIKDPPAANGGGAEISNVTFLDEYRNKQDARISCVALTTEQYCFWDRFPFSTAPVPGFIRKIYQGEEKTYMSHINQNVYTIQDRLNSDKHYYLSEGQFCSPECRLAYIRENEHNPLYEEAETLLFELFGPVECAPSWRLLKAYGGPYSIEQFRECCKMKTYTFEGLLTEPLYFSYKENYYVK